MTLQDVSMKSLKFRKMLLDWIIRENKDDSRIDEPKRQLSIIEKEMARRAERPPDLVVGLDTLKIKGTNKLGG